MMYFREDEFRCPCCGQVQVAASLLVILQAARMVYGHPIHVTSGFRCPKHNKEVGGKDTSKHLIGYASDITGRDFAALKATIGNLFIITNHVGAIAMNFGVNTPRRFIHIDTAPGLIRMWTYSKDSLVFKLMDQNDLRLALADAMNEVKQLNWPSIIWDIPRD